MQVLTTTGPEALQETGGEILILTDGVETEPPFVADVMEAVTVREFEKLLLCLLINKKFSFLSQKKIL